jgi:MFS family permease
MTASRSSSARSSRLLRLYGVLSALESLPGALMFPVIVLLIQARGHPVADVALVFTMFGFAALVLEVPTGGLADAYGRRRMLLCSAVLCTFAYGLLTVAQSLWQFALAGVILAAGRSLGSGILNSWYVDSGPDTADPVRLARRLAVGEQVRSCAMAFGTLMGGILPLVCGQVEWFAGPVVTPLAVPLLVACLLCGLFMVAIRQMGAGPHHSHSTQRSSERHDGLYATLRSALYTAARDRIITMLAVVTFGLGCSISILEIVWPSRTTEILDDPQTGALAYGVVLTAAFLVRAGGARSAPRLAVLAGGAMPVTAALGFLIGVCMLAFAVSRSLIVFGAVFLLVQFLLAAAETVGDGLLHARATAAQRVTLVSLQSFAFQVGTLGGNLIASGAGRSGGATMAWLIGGAVTAGTALLLLPLWLERGRPSTEDLPSGSSAAMAPDRRDGEPADRKVNG